jgi:hypothetical protein
LIVFCFFVLFFFNDPKKNKKKKKKLTPFAVSNSPYTHTHTHTKDDGWIVANAETEWQSLGPRSPALGFSSDCVVMRTASGFTSVTTASGGAACASACVLGSVPCCIRTLVVRLAERAPASGPAPAYLLAAADASGAAFTPVGDGWRGEREFSLLDVSTAVATSGRASSESSAHVESSAMYGSRLALRQITFASCPATTLTAIPSGWTLAPAHPAILALLRTRPQACVVLAATAGADAVSVVNSTSSAACSGPDGSAAGLAISISVISTPAGLVHLSATCAAGAVAAGAMPRLVVLVTRRSATAAPVPGSDPFADLPGARPTPTPSVLPSVVPAATPAPGCSVTGCGTNALCGANDRCTCAAGFIVNATSPVQACVPVVPDVADIDCGVGSPAARSMAAFLALNAETGTVVARQIDECTCEGRRIL